MEHVTVVLFHARDTFENHHYRAPFGTHVDCFERSVQD
jgi:hypothetical protein